MNKINFTKAILILMFPLFFLVSCSKPYEKYVGYWKLEGSKYNNITEISKNGDVYLFTQNIFNKNNKPIAMEESKNELAINNGFLLINLKLADDSTMLIENEKYTKIPQSEVDEIKKNVDKCETVIKDFINEIKPYDKWTATAADIRKIEEIQPKYEQLASKIQGCELRRY